MLLEEDLMTDDVRTKNEEKWQKATNKVIANNLLENVVKLLDGKLKHVYSKDSYGEEINKIVIEYEVDK